MLNLLIFVGKDLGWVCCECTQGGGGDWAKVLGFRGARFGRGDTDLTVDVFGALFWLAGACLGF